VPYHRALWLAMLLVASGPSTLASQQRPLRVLVPGLQVSARRNLTFGEVFRGTPTSVTPTDYRAAQFEITASWNTQIQVDLVLPLAMLSGTGEALPLVFGPGDGLVEHEGGVPLPGYAFDPRSPVVTTLTADGKVLISLGGTADPARAQSRGQYQGTVTVIVADLGT
jgi:hypothetical protein